MPAALNGIVGFKPSRGLVSAVGLVPACRSLDCLSLMARTGRRVRPSAADRRAPDRPTPESPEAEPGRDGAPVRVGLPKRWSSSSSATRDGAAHTIRPRRRSPGCPTQHGPPLRPCSPPVNCCTRVRGWPSASSSSATSSTRTRDALKAKETAELALKLADRRKDEFLATLAHELRTPFSAMRSAIDLLSRQPSLSADTVWPLEMLDRQLDQATRLADDLLDVSRIAEGKIEIKKTRVEIGAIIHEVVESTRARQAGSESSHEFDVRLPDDPLFLSADSVRLAQIVQNLLNNAFRYTPSGGKIGLLVTRQGDDVVITVGDSGIGISHEDLTTIFTMFAQVPSGHGRSKGGLGIGLALVRALVQLHDGQLTAASEGPGKGSTFEVRLPALRADHASSVEETRLSAANQSLSAPSKQRRVLVVDDSEDAAASLALLLQAEGHTVETASCGLDALRLEDAFHPEAVILDLGLPDIDGKEVARRIRSRRGSDVMLIALTGWQAEVELNPEENPLDAYFVKPANISELLDKLANKTQ